jgi:hypothetical protein
VRPFLDFKASATELFLELEVENHGAGPALNVRIEAKVDGKIVPSDTSEIWPQPLLRALQVRDEDLAHKIQRGFITMPTVHMRPGGQIKLLDLRFAGLIDVPALCRRISFEAHYESVYLDEDEPFVARMDWPSNYGMK